VIAGLVLAGGAGTRFGGSSKLLADLDGRPLLEYAVRAQCAVSAIDRVVVVLGAFAEAVGEAVDFGRAETVVCEEWQDGQAASLRCGLRKVADADKVLVTVGDQPLLTAEVIARFVSEPPGTRATYEGRPGHPVVLGRSLIAAAMGLTGDEGARGLLRGGPTIECGALCSGRDVDTPEDLEAIRSSIGQGK
jgi:molybdenum cofactor cytidylyltransferase